MIRIALRFDDPSPTSDHALERDLLEIFAGLGIPLTMAVVPTGRDGVEIRPDNVPHLVAAHRSGMLEVALHGYSHKPLATNAQGVSSEFQGMPMDVQEQHIDTGRKLLEATFSGRIQGFIPPWNTYDATTLDILARRGFDYISISNATRIRRNPQLRMISHTCHVSQLEGAYLQAKHYSNSAIIVAIMHHYDFHGLVRQDQHTAQLPRQLEETLKWLQGEADVKFNTLSEIATTLSIEEAWRAQSRQHRVGEMNWRLRQLFPNKQLLTRPLWQYLLTRKWHEHA